MRLTVCGLFVALSLNVSVPAREPVVAGVNVTLIVQVAPAAILAPQVLVAIEKSPLGRNTGKREWRVFAIRQHD